MVEFRIPTNLVARLLSERIKTEIEMREEANLLPIGSTPEGLRTSQIIEIIEAAVFDLVALLPAHLLTQNNNLDEILTNAIKSLPIAYERHEFSEYSIENVRKILHPLKSLFKVSDYEDVFVNN